MRDQTKREKLISTIKKLIAKSEGTNNQAEADIFMHKVRDMLHSYNISMEEVKDFEDDLVQRGDEIELSRSLSYVVNLVPAIARFYGAQTIMFRGKKKHKFIVYGRLSATSTFSMMLPFIMKQIRVQAKQLEKKGSYETYTRALTGVANALTYRIMQTVAESQVKGLENALVPVDQILLKMKSDFPFLRQRNFKSSGFNADALDAAGNIGMDIQMKDHPQRLLE